MGVGVFRMWWGVWCGVVIGTRGRASRSGRAVVEMMVNGDGVWCYNVSIWLIFFEDLCVFVRCWIRKSGGELTCARSAARRAWRTSRRLVIRRLE